MKNIEFIILIWKIAMESIIIIIINKILKSNVQLTNEVHS